MKASRVAAIGLVAAATFWIASGQLFPHKTDESRAAIVTNEAAQKPFRVAVATAAVTPHSRKLILSGRRAAPTVESDVYQQVEIERGSFRRIVELGADVQADAAKARYEDGILRIELPLVQADTNARSVPIEREA